MLIMKGPNVRQGSELNNAVIHDIAPTILHAMNLPVPSDMDGRVLEEVFNDGYMAASPIKTLGPSAPSDGDGSGYQEEEAEEIMERLRELGYLG
jgi:arylsulfatase A-like enzyme